MLADRLTISRHLTQGFTVTHCKPFVVSSLGLETLPKQDAMAEVLIVPLFVFQS